MIKKIDKNVVRQRKHARVRKKISGTATCPRLCVFRSNKHIYAQVINDEMGTTLCSASTKEASLFEVGTSTSNLEAAKKIGSLVAERALAAGIDTVVFDRGGYLYHGRVAALAEAAREAGLKF